MSVLLLGPYLGSFKEEILSFRPHVRWLLEIKREDFDSVYINTHSNRKFLYYDFIDSDKIISIFENISREELGQKGYIHENVDQRDYNLIVRSMKDLISSIENCSKRDIEQISLNYIKSTPPVEYHKKIFEKIQVPDDLLPEHKDKIVFIPDRSGRKRDLLAVKSYLDLKRDYVVIGDQRTRFRSENVVLNMVDYFENGWKYIVKCINQSRAVICPVGYWTTIANMQGIPVFSWGNNIGQHKENGIYNFNNKKCIVIPFDKESSRKMLVDMIDYFLNEVNNEI